MKKFFGYGVFYLIGILFIISMMLRVESLDNKVSKAENKTNNSEVVYTLK